MHVIVESAAFAIAPIFLANMTIIAINGTATPFTRAWISFQNVCQDVERFQLQRRVIEGTVRNQALVSHVEVIAGFLLLNSLVVCEPFFRCWFRDHYVESLAIFVNGDHPFSLWSRNRQVIRKVVSISLLSAIHGKWLNKVWWLP